MQKMLTIYNGRQHFWQWDSGQRLVVESGTICEVHFRNPDGEDALIVSTYDMDGKTVADVPNILLQKSGQISAWVYVCVGDDCTISEQSFEVWPRQKPAGYVYTETELKHYSDFDERLKALEGAGVVLPPVTAEDEGKVMTVVDGVWAARSLPKYSGAYEVTPLANEEATLKTAQKFMDSNVVVKQIPYFETSNTADGETVYIGTEVDIYGNQ